jgi:hypothetical protein
VVIEEHTKDAAARDSQEFRPFARRVRSSFNRQRRVAAPVVVLFFPRSPPNVAGFVVPVIVNTVERVERMTIRSLPLGTRTNVGQEVCERVDPTVTDFNASPSMMGVSSVLGIRASTGHGGPRAVFRGDKPNYGVSMLPCRCSKNASIIDTEAATGFGLTVAQKQRERCNLAPTRAITFPSHTPGTGFARDNRQTSKHLACKVDKPHERRIA